VRRAALFVGALVSSVVVSAGGEPAPTPKTLEGRPPQEWLSPIQGRIDAARAGDTVVVEAGEYRGDVWVDKPLRLVGHGRPRLVGSGEGSVVLVRAPDVLVEGFDIDGLGGGNLGEDDSGVHVAGERVTVRDCRIENTLFGVYLRQAHGSAVVGCQIRGIPD